MRRRRGSLKRKSFNRKRGRSKRVNRYRMSRGGIRL